jgi:hypothetical protein
MLYGFTVIQLLSGQAALLFDESTVMLGFGVPALGSSVSTSFSAGIHHCLYFFQQAFGYSFLRPFHSVNLAVDVLIPAVSCFL